ncbi:MAG: hydrogenase iron-sulfur subunit [Cyanobacteria bacterium]|nr:hydrogenase iron-sulfur subunit [Cyanobacteriota bacterium]
MAEGKTVITLICERAAEVSDILDKNDQISGMPNVKVVKFPCSGMIQPQMVETALKSGASGVVVCGCQIGDCYFREGNKMIRDRLLGDRPPGLKKTVDRRRVMALWLSRLQKSRFLSETENFVEYVARLDTTEGAKPAAAAAKPAAAPAPKPSTPAPEAKALPAVAEPPKNEVAKVEPGNEVTKVEAAKPAASGDGETVATTASSGSGTAAANTAAPGETKPAASGSDTSDNPAIKADEEKADAGKSSLAGLKDVNRPAGEGGKEEGSAEKTSEG